MINEWFKEVMKRANPEHLGMILVHNGVVRGISMSGNPVRAMKLSYDQNLIIPIYKQKPGVVEVKVWVNSGNLKVGDNLMFLLVAGRFRTDIVPVVEELLSLIKNEMVTEEEVQSSVSS